LCFLSAFIFISFFHLLMVHSSPCFHFFHISSIPSFDTFLTSLSLSLSHFFHSCLRSWCTRSTLCIIMVQPLCLLRSREERLRTKRRRTVACARPCVMCKLKTSEWFLCYF
jgi:hypothetical protein